MILSRKNPFLHSKHAGDLGAGDELQYLAMPTEQVFPRKHGYVESLEPNSQKNGLRMCFALGKVCGARRSANLRSGLASAMVIVIISALGVEAQEASEIPLNFQRDVRPILADNCFQCHGPDESARKAELRLDTEDGLFLERQNGHAVVPGNPEGSLLYQRITHENQRRRMPPTQASMTLSDGNIEALRQWINEGASWNQHWAFTKIERPEPPEPPNDGWSRNAVDQFVLAKLRSEGFAPAPEADSRALVRRLALDLTGLPPEPKVVEQFLSDDSDKAYEGLVEQFLESEHWGEHRARYWLDVARYGDTHGIHIDNYREMYPYRDWVIESFNNNKPFDEFAVEQIAGDRLSEPTLDQLIASGFHRNNITTNEGGAIPEEWEAVYAKDRADTTGTVFLGLTVGCATCHDHKFDPITQRDFYAMTAFFRNTTQYVMDGNVSDTPPILVVPADEDRELGHSLRIEAGILERGIVRREMSAGNLLREWIATEEYRQIQAPLETSTQLMSLVLKDSEPPVVEQAGQFREISLQSGATIGAGPLGELALMFGEESWVELPALRLDTDTPFSLGMWVYTPEEGGSFWLGGQADPLDGLRGWRIEIGERQIFFHMVGEESEADGDRNAFHLFPTNIKRLPAGEWTHVVFTYDGSGERSGLRVYPDGEVVETEGSEFFANVNGSIRTDEPFVLGKGRLAVGPSGDAPPPRYFAGGRIADLRVFSRVLTVQEAKVLSAWPTLRQARGKSPADLNSEEWEALQYFYLSVKDEEYRKLVARRQEIDREWREIRRRGGVTHVMNERSDTEPEARVLFRGMYDQPRERVAADVPGFLPRMDSSLPRNRLGLAQWIVDEANPLTSRVAVNRFWQEVFGTGLVRTSEDFGAQGEMPSHPALLDWLAAEFQETEWDVKQLFRTMTLSATYRQSAQSTEVQVERDRENRLLSRGPRFRMDAEMVRDYALASSGLLVRTIGGPSVRPYQPEGVWERVAMPQSNTRIYQQGAGEELYRRSLYTFWKRAAPPASMEIFNAPTREISTVRRERTNTPLQALVTMNDPQFIEASRYFAQRAMREAGDLSKERLDFIATRLLMRSLSEEEEAVALRSYERLLEAYEGDLPQASRLLGVGETEPDLSLPVAESAAWTMLLSQFMNLDEVLNK